MKRKLLFGALNAIALLSASAIMAQNFQTMPVQSGYTADVIANGVGSSSVSTNNDVDGVSYAFVARDFQLTSTSAPITFGIPVDGIINSVVASTPGLSYTLGNLSGNNSLRLAAANDSGTLTFTVPKAATKLYMLSTSGSGGSTVSVTVNFSDGTSQQFTGISIADWYTGTNIAIQGFGRIKKPTTPSTANDDIPSPEGGTNPRLYQNELVIDATNQTKLIQSVTVTKTAGTGIPNIFAFSADVYSDCAPPVLQPVSGITVNSALVSWTASSNAVSYDVYHSTSNTTPTSTTTPTYPGVTGTSTTIGGLNSNTTYYYWVRSNCSTATGQSVWSFAGTFKTACSTFTVPYTENFDTTSTGNSTSPNAPSCWAYLESASFAGYGYVVASNNYSAPNSYYLNNSSSTTGSQMLVSPPTINLSDGTKRVRFYAKAGGSGYTLLVGTLSNPTDPASFTQIGSAIALTTTHTQYTVNIPAGSDLQLAFKHGMGASSRSIYLDNITVQDIPSCVEPTAVTSSNVAANTATIGWTAPAALPAMGYEVYYSTTNTAPTSATILDATNSATSTTTSASLNGLSATTVYYVWVRSRCSASDVSEWSLGATFTTPCASVVPSYTNDFSSIPGTCWTNALSGGSPATGPTGNTAYWAVDGFLNSGSTGAIRMELYSNTRVGWLKTIPFNLSAGGYRVKFDYGVTTFSGTTASAMGSDDVVQFLVSNDSGTTWTVLQTWDVNNTPSNSTNTYIYNLTGNISPNTVFAFYGSEGSVNDLPDYNFYVDNFIVELIPLSTSEVNADEKQIKIHPNPFKDILNIAETKDMKSVIITDVTGRVVKTIDNPSKQLYLGELNAGLYLVTINFKDGSKSTVKAIKQ
ncbi:hypothetical protein CHRYSEOSP005_07800 [Chryseobacterium sp. Alg-005]|uniref:fibronectin type III domain-containing protein n=1 Tax=Chryseobacterium sp. Alg-005 TaxID=3159516 RepID=UPI0035558355